LLEEEARYGRYNMVIKYRVVPRDFGRYLGRNVLEVEKVCAATRTFSLSEYLEARCMHFIIHAFYNLKAMHELVVLLRLSGASVFGWLRALNEVIKTDNGPVGEIYWGFCAEAREELWDSREELLAYYAEESNFVKLFTGEKGANLIMKYGAVTLENIRSFWELGVKQFRRIAPQLDAGFVVDLARYCVCLRGDLFNVESSRFTREFDYDHLAWNRAICGGDGPAIPEREPVNIEFYRNPDQLKLLRDSLRTYGDNQDARGKILARVGPVNLFWKSRRQ